MDLEWSVDGLTDPVRPPYGVLFLVLEGKLADNFGL